MTRASYKRADLRSSLVEFQQPLTFGSALNQQRFPIVLNTLPSNITSLQRFCAREFSAARRISMETTVLQADTVVPPNSPD